MPRNSAVNTENLLPGKIRKRGCSSSASSSSSIIQNYRFKRAILVRKRGGSSTPVPTWKLMGKTQSAGLDSARSQRSGVKGKLQREPQQPVSARKLAATLWGMNEMPTLKAAEAAVREKRRATTEGRGRERAVAAVATSVHSGSLPRHLSDPSHSPVSERFDRSGTCSRHRRAPSISQKLRLMDSTGAFGSVSNASFMEVETRSRAETPRGSSVGLKSRLKDVSNALTNSKELLKIINRIWRSEARPSSSLSLISALHAELERARLQVNQLIQEQGTDKNEINYRRKCFAEEKAAWKNREQKLVESAIESIAGELEVEKKLRRRFESLNKKLGKELSVTKEYLGKTAKELENEKRARVVIEQVCDELAKDIGDDKVEVEEWRRESEKLCEEVEKEREMMQFADVLREERVQMKLSEAKYDLEEKNAAVDKLRSRLEAFLGNKKGKEKGRASFNQMNEEDIAAYINQARSILQHNEQNEGDEGEAEDNVECEEDSDESDLHSVELNTENNSKSYKWTHPTGTPRIPRDLREASIDEEIKGRKSTSSRAPRRNTPLQRSISDGVGCMHNDRLPFLGDGLERGRFSESDRQGYQSSKGLRDYFFSGSRLGLPRGYSSPTRPAGQARSLRDPSNAPLHRPPAAQGHISRSRLAEVKGDARKSK